ncbi:MAG: SufD family Fe-S cluster assembly protein [Eubacterium sp.]|nr:SufD family Fe-S cluster assembly protein [Eubacterium sp.]
MSRNLIINKLPAYTYNWLHMNEAQLPGVSAVEEAPVAAEVPAEIRQDVMKAETAAADAAKILTGAGEDMDALLADAGIGVQTYTVPAGVRVTDDAVRLKLAYADQGFVYETKKTGAAPQADSRDSADAAGTGRINAFRYVLEPDSEMTVVMDYTADQDAAGLAAVQTKIFAAKNSVLHLVQIQQLGENFTLLNDIGGFCEEGARVELIRLILNGKNTFDGCRVELAGEKSSLGVDIGYLCKNDDHLDMNYDAYHTGKRTASEMNISGVLRDRAFKLFRGTIDFQNGCSGAVGDELEDVMLMDSTVVNQTIPLILCAEEDVVGNHGATIGRLDDQLLFYMESRGMNREDIYEMMAKARIDAVIRKIPDEKTRLRMMPEVEEAE